MQSLSRERSLFLSQRYAVRRLLTCPAWEFKAPHEHSIPLSKETGQLLIVHFEMESYILVPMNIKEQFETLKYTFTRSSLGHE